MKYQRHLMVATTVPLAVISLTCSFVIRFDLTLPKDQYTNVVIGSALFAAARLPITYIYERKRRLWNYVGLRDVVGLLVVGLTGSIVAATMTWGVLGSSFPRSIYLIDVMLWFIVTAAMVFSPRVVREFWPGARNTTPSKSVLIYGAGEAGLTLVKEIRNNNRLGINIVGFLDDDLNKAGASVCGIRILGNGYSAAQIVRTHARRSRAIHEIIIAMPSADKQQMRHVIANCRSAEIPFTTVPSLSELLDGKLLSRQIREVSVDDLLGRAPVHVSEQDIGKYVNGRTVLITGGCGSIGSELCRQVARFGPKRLVIFDQAESEMFMLALELRGKFPTLDLATEIGDIVHYQRVLDVLQEHNIQAVFHAAAYKHVPLMEAHVLEAAKNNVIGTYNVVTAARQHGVERFLMISSDKAVNPTSIMGVTKRIGEILVGSVGSNEAKGTYLSVRFGNVLASNGSVVHIFKRQIAQGGPVTVTHPEMCRYFMSISEAVQLVLQAYAMGNENEVYVLDMGEPVRIVDLATNMIRLAGLTPGDDVEIRYTGLRPGEKLFEEINSFDERLAPTFHEKIKIFRAQNPHSRDLSTWILDLEGMIRARNSAAVKEHLLQLVPEYIGLRQQPQFTYKPTPALQDACA